MRPDDTRQGSEEVVRQVPEEAEALQRSYLAGCTHWRVLESQLPNKIVNLLCTIIDQDNKLTVWWGS